MKEFFRKILLFLADYITPILTIIIGIYVAKHYEEYKIEEILAYIITMLVLIAGTLLIEKLVQLSSIDRRVKKIETRLVESDIFMYCHASKFWEDALNSAKSLFISGGSLFHVIPEKSGDFDVLLKNGCKIEVVVVKPFSEAAKLLYNNVIKEIHNSDNFSGNIIQTLDFLIKYKKEYPEQLIIRLNDNVPAFGIFAIYRDSHPKKIQVNLFSEKVPYDKRLALSLDNSFEKDRFAYEYFCNQITLLRERLTESSIEDLEAIVKLKKNDNK